MTSASKHPFLTFVVSGISAFVLIGGAMVTLQAVQQPQSTMSKAYMTTPRNTPVPIIVRSTPRPAVPTPRPPASATARPTPRMMMKNY